MFRSPTIFKEGLASRRFRKEAGEIEGDGAGLDLEIRIPRAEGRPFVSFRSSEETPLNARNFWK